MLLGAASFWEGVDFPGEELEVLVLARLPFLVPSDPLVRLVLNLFPEVGGSQSETVWAARCLETRFSPRFKVAMPTCEKALGFRC